MIARRVSGISTGATGPRRPVSPPRGAAATRAGGRLLATVAFLATLAGPVHAGPATNLAFTTQPSGTATTGLAFGTQPAVTVEDAAGSTVTDDTSTVTLALTSAGGATLTCTGGVSKAAEAGVATFDGCKIDKAGDLHPDGDRRRPDLGGQRQHGGQHDRELDRLGCA